MFCTVCGKEVPDESKFCSFCGSPTASAQPYEQPAQQYAPPGGQQYYQYGQQPPPRPQVLIYPRPHSLALVIILNFLFPGIGNIVLGQTLKGIVIFLAAMFTCGVLWFPASILTIVDGVMLSNKLNTGQPIGEWEFFG